jgi:hypothetical protein
MPIQLGEDMPQQPSLLGVIDNLTILRSEAPASRSFVLAWLRALHLDPERPTHARPRTGPNGSRRSSFRTKKQFAVIDPAPLLQTCLGGTPSRRSGTGVFGGACRVIGRPLHRLSGYRTPIGVKAERWLSAVHGGFAVQRLQSRYHSWCRSNAHRRSSTRACPAGLLHMQSDSECRVARGRGSSRQ